jgi:transcription initiation factor IIE alpha subunit
MINLMTDKDITIKNLKDRKEEINEELEFKNTQSLSEELYEIEDTLKKLGVNENNTSNFS